MVDLARLPSPRRTDPLRPLHPQESTGKSSVLERVLGIPLFPRGADIVTRMPVRLRLAHLDDAGLAAFCAAESLRADAAGIYVRVSALKARDGTTTERTPWEGPLAAHGAAAQGEQPTRLISKVMQQASSSKADGSNVGVSEDTILQLEVRARGLPDVNLLDLPGVVGGAVDGEPADMAERTRRLVERHLKEPDTLVLVVVEATAASVRNSLAFSLVAAANKVDKAVGVLTKADGCIGPSLTRLKSRLEGTAKDLPTLSYGYVAVVNRDSCDGRNLSIAAAAVEEQAWLAAHLPEQLRGASGGDALVERLATMLGAYVREQWATRALTLLRKARAERRAALALLGEEVAANNAARAATLGAVLAPIPAWLRLVGDAQRWAPVSAAIAAEMGTAQAAMMAVNAVGAFSETNFVQQMAHYARVMDHGEQHAHAALDAAANTKGGADGAWAGAIMRALAAVIEEHSGALPLRPRRFVYLHDQVLLLFAEQLDAELPAMHARLRGLHKLLQVRAQEPNTMHSLTNAGALDSARIAHRVKGVLAGLQRSIEEEALAVTARALLAAGGPLASAELLGQALLARPENGLAALLAEDGATAARRRALKRAGSDLRTAIVAIAGLHDPPRLLPEDAPDEPELPLSSGGQPDATPRAEQRPRARGL